MRIGYGYAGAVALAALQVAYFWGRVPDVIASHFDGNGHPNGFMTRPAFFGFYLGILAFVMLLFGLLARLSKMLPTELINVPNRDYWFSPARAEESRAWLWGQLQSFGLVVALFLVVVMQLVLQANTGGGAPVQLPTERIVICLAGLAGSSAFLLIRIVRRFSRVP